VIIDKDNTTLSRARQDAASRAHQADPRSDRGDHSDYDKRNYRSASQAGGGVAIIKVGAATRPMKEKKARVEDALNATRGGGEGSCGGGVALLRASSASMLR